MFDPYNMVFQSKMIIMKQSSFSSTFNLSLNFISFVWKHIYIYMSYQWVQTKFIYKWDSEESRWLLWICIPLIVIKYNQVLIWNVQPLRSHFDSFCLHRSPIFLIITLYGPRQANLVLIAYASSEGSGEPAHPRSLARISAARSYEQWVKRNLQTES